MATGDNRRIIQASELDIQKINEALRHLSEWCGRLEGRSGPVKLRDSIEVASEKSTFMDFVSPTATNASIAVFGTEDATLAFAKGSRREDSGEWIATDTVSVIWGLSRSGTGTLYVNTGLTIGQAFEPTVSFVVGVSGSVSPHVLDSATHTISGKTAGHVLQALTATTFGFAALTGLNVTNTPAGNIAATTVQAAINELDSEKVIKAGDTMTGTLQVPKLEVDGTNFFLDSDATYSYIQLDTNDFLYYNKSTNAFRFFAGGTEVAQFTPTVLYSFVKHIFNNDSNFSLDLVSSNPRLTLDTNDYLQYERSTNRLTLSVPSGLAAPTHSTAFNFREDFISSNAALSGTIGASGLSFLTTGNGGAAGLTTEAGHPGIFSFTSGTTLNGITVLYHEANYYTIRLGDIDIATWVGAVSAKQGSTRFIFTPGVVTDAPNGEIGFEVATADTNWYSKTTDGSGTTRKDTGVAFGTGWFTFQLVRNGSSWDFYINGTQRTNHSGGAENVPADTVATQMVVQTKSNGTSVTVKTDLLDAYGVVERT